MKWLMPMSIEIKKHRKDFIMFTVVYQNFYPLCQVFKKIISGIFNMKIYFKLSQKTPPALNMLPRFVIDIKNLTFC